jgi:hypothetical protein
MEVGVETEITGPCVEDGGESEVGTQTVRVAAELEECLGSRLEEEAEDELSVVEGQPPQLFGKGEDDVEIVGGENALHLVVQPNGLAKVLALRAVSVSTGVVGRALEEAAVAHIDMAAQGGGTTGLDGAHGARLFRGQGVGFPKCLAVAAKDLGHLETGPP